MHVSQDRYVEVPRTAITRPAPPTFGWAPPHSRRRDADRMARLIREYFETEAEGENHA